MDGSEFDFQHGFLEGFFFHVSRLINLLVKTTYCMVYKLLFSLQCFYELQLNFKAVYLNRLKLHFAYAFSFDDNASLDYVKSF